MYGVDLPPYSQLPTTTHLTKSLELSKKALFFLLMLACSSSWHFYSSTRPPAFSISSTNHQNTGRYQGDGLINKLLLLLLSYRIFLSSNLTLKYLDSRLFIVRLQNHRLGRFFNGSSKQRCKVVNGAIKPINHNGSYRVSKVQICIFKKNMY